MGSVPEQTPPRRPFARSDLRRIASLYRPHRRRLTAIGSLLFVSAVLAVIPPLLLARIIDDAIPDRDTGLLVALALAMVVLAVAGGLLQHAHTLLTHHVGQRVMHELRTALYGHLQRLPLRFFTARQAGELLSRVGNDIGGLQGVITTAASGTFTNIVTVVAAGIAMLLLDWRLALLAFALLPPVVLIVGQVGGRRRALAGERQRMLARLTTRLEQTLSISGMLLARSTGQNARLEGAFAEQSDELADLEVRTRTSGQGRLTVMAIALAALPALAYLAGGLLVTTGISAISIGTLVAFATVQARLLAPVASLAGTLIAVQTSLAHFERVFEILDEPTADAERPGAAPLPATSGPRTVAFEDVRFRYAANGPLVLDGVNFTLEPGTKTALVGLTGSGKTTITYLLTRLYEATSGRVAIEGRDVHDVEQDSLAAAVGVVSQETFLLHASVRENLLFAAPGAIDSELRAATEAAQLHETILGFPEGYDTVVGERGHRLSGGERQRLAIARTLLRNPPVLILDEATSALDLETEGALQEALARLAADRTTLAISHRPTAVADADQILVLDGGRIVEQGRHEELLASDGRYAALLARDVSVSTLR